MDIVIDGTRAMIVAKMLNDREIQFAVVLTDSKAPSLYKRLRSPIASFTSKLRSPNKKKKDLMNWKDYHPLQTINDFIDSLEKYHPSICTVYTIGKSVEGRDIKLIKISNSDAKNTAIWLDGCIHAREWISVAVVTYIANHIAKNFDVQPDSITNKDWYLVPVVNPDGYHHTHIQDRMWRKNRARNGTTICGVDLNRNFSYQWGRNGYDNCTTSNDPMHLNYRGPTAFSEPETTAIKDIILYSGIPFKVFLTFHSYSEAIAFPWCYTADPCVDYVSLLEGGTAMARAIFETHGRKYKVGNFKDIMYYAGGTSIDWSYGTANIPFSYIVELRGKEHKFLLPKEEIQDCCEEILNGVKALAKYVDTKESVNCLVLPQTFQ